MALETGTYDASTSSPEEPWPIGMIKPSRGQGQIIFGSPSMRPAGYWPSAGDKVEFERYANHPDWAKMVRAAREA
jgi:hypothetical protein